MAAIFCISSAFSFSNKLFMGTKRCYQTKKLSVFVPSSNIQWTLGSTDKIEYSPASKRINHIVQQQFLYTGRTKETSTIIQFQKSRQYSRNSSGAHCDKQNNPLIAITGSPGCGKSSFLVNFPASPEYRQFSGDHTIVSAISFNGGIGGVCDHFAVRILYGGAKAMGLLDDDSEPYSKFYGRLFDLIPDNSVGVGMVIQILQRIFGEDRPVLVLVDELSKADNAEAVLKQLCTLLDLYSNVNVVMSIQSPSLLVKSPACRGRPINYAVLESLSQFDIGKAECRVWADAVLSLVPSDKNVDEKVVRLLRCVYLLYSGHTGSLLRLTTMMQQGGFNALAEHLVDKTAVEVLAYLVTNRILPLGYGVASLSNLSPSVIEHYVLVTNPVVEDSNPNFGDMLACGQVNIKNEHDNLFDISTSTIAFLDLFLRDAYNWQDVNLPFHRIFHQLFHDVFWKKPDFSVLWKRIVCYTLISRVCRAEVTPAFSEALGIGLHRSEVNLECLRSLQVVLGVEPEQDYPSLLIVPQERNSEGFDALFKVRGKGESGVLVYLHMKLQLPLSKSFSAVVASMVINNIRDFILRSDDMSQGTIPRMILYIFDDVDSYTNDSYLQQDVIAAINDTDLKEDPTIIRLSLQFVSENWGRIHFVGRKKLEEWINSSLLPLLNIASEVEVVA